MTDTPVSTPAATEPGLVLAWPPNPPLVLENSPLAAGAGFVWAKIRPLVLGDFTMDEWKYSEFDDRYSPPKEVFALCKLTMIPSVREEFRTIPALHKRFLDDGRKALASYQRIDELYVQFKEPVKYQGSRGKDDKRVRFDQAISRLRVEVTDNGDIDIQLAIVKANEMVMEYLCDQRKRFLEHTIGWATKMDSYETAEVDKLADTKMLIDQLTVLEAQAEGLRKVIRERRVSVIKKNWNDKDHEGYPMEVLTAVREKLTKDGVHDSHVRVMWPA